MFGGQFEQIAHGIKDKRAFDLGCGNGVLADSLSKMGFTVTGVDASESGVAQARLWFPNCTFEVASGYDDLAARFGTFPLVISVEVIEHLMQPKLFAKRFYDLLEPGGCGIITTPYHGWLKNVTISVAGKWDRHHGVDWDGGHVKFFSVATLTAMLAEEGGENIVIERVGRVPALAKSMVAIFTKANGTGIT